MLTDEITSDARDALFSYDKERAVQIVRNFHAQKGDVLELLNEGFIPLINEIGDKFSCGEIFLPELIMCAEVMQEVTGTVVSLLPKSEALKQHRGVLVFGTVQGDVHDIGKTLVITMLEVNGFNVHDLGRDVSVQKFIDKARETKADIIGSSALLSTTMLVQEELEKQLKQIGMKGKIKTMVGGAPVTVRWADKIGADAYGEDAADAVTAADRLMME